MITRYSWMDPEEFFRELKSHARQRACELLEEAVNRLDACLDLNAHYEEQIEQLEEQIAGLEEALDQDGDCGCHPRG